MQNSVLFYNIFTETGYEILKENIMNNAKIFYSITVKNNTRSGSSRRYTLSTNDPAGEITKAINEKSGISFICDFTCTTIVPSGYSTSSGEIHEQSIRLDLPKNLEIKKFIAKQALSIDNFSPSSYHDETDIREWVKELSSLSKGK